jgi:hypothetical protein
MKVNIYILYEHEDQIKAMECRKQQRVAGPWWARGGVEAFGGTVAVSVDLMSCVDRGARWLDVSLS